MTHSMLPTTSRTGTKYCIHASNLPESLMVGDWRAFKDFIRSNIRGQPGKVVPDLANCRVLVDLKSEEDAHMAWEALTRAPIDGNVLVVNVFRCSSTRGAERIFSNESHSLGSLADYFGSGKISAAVSNPYILAPLTPAAPVISHASSAPNIPFAAISAPYYSASSLYQPTPLPMGYIQAPVDQLPPIPEAPMLPALRMQLNYQPRHVYQENQYGLPVNVTQGTIRTERLCVHVSNLPKDVDESDVEKLLRRKKLLHFTNVSVNLDNRTGKCKGSALVTFESAESAEKAVDVLDELKYMKKQLRVRRAKESTPVVQQPYMVVNGST